MMTANNVTVCDINSQYPSDDNHSTRLIKYRYELTPVTDPHLIFPIVAITNCCFQSKFKGNETCIRPSTFDLNQDLKFHSLVSTFTRQYAILAVEKINMHCGIGKNKWCKGYSISVLDQRTTQHAFNQLTLCQFYYIHMCSVAEQNLS